MSANNEEHTKALKENNSLLQKILNKFNLSKEVKNAASVLADGGSIYYDGELKEGTAVFSDEALTTPLADGSYTLENEDTVEVKDGVVTTVTPKEDSGAENLAEENEALKAEVAELKASNKELTDAVNASNEILKKLENITSKGNSTNKSTVFNNSGKQGKAEKTLEEIRQEKESRRQSYNQAK